MSGKQAKKIRSEVKKMAGTMSVEILNSMQKLVLLERIKLCFIILFKRKRGNK